ncbi:hypothetical protein [uncultured Algimonas sp.]|uniref:hypothetical protein n=1 Tax=uncultured Algimonas sp. TaxID=1547920 RepID=UPI00261CC537|nr:hypothetical protein [uncultured Algimonas sp.]
MTHPFRAAALAAGALFALPPAFVQAHDTDPTAPHALDHAPIGVMADHRHGAGEFMLSYRFMTMDMDGNRQGTDPISPEAIATTVPNRLAGQPMQPPTLRVVPTDMRMDMHMVGAMYGLSDRITLMAMGSYLDNSMNHLTFAGPTGPTVRGGFETGSRGFGDTTLSAIVGLDDGSHKSRQVNLVLGLSVPTGSNTQTDQVLAPTGMTPTLRLPYPMQLGSSTWDAKPAISYLDRNGRFGWGGQLSARVPLERNAKGYRFGSRGEATAWVAYEPAPWISGSLRMKGATQGRINGEDPVLRAPVQTTDPRNQGGETLDLLFGVNLAAQTGALRGHRLGAELGLPLHRDLNGVQLETDMTLTLGWQYAFGG